MRTLPNVIVTLLLLCPHSGLLAAEQPRDESVPDQRGDEEIAGVGLALRVQDGQWIVDAVVPNTSAEKCGEIHAGDRILAIAQVDHKPISLREHSLREVVGMIRGKAGTKVRLTVVPRGHPAEHVKVVTLVRGDVKWLNAFGDGRLLPMGTPIPDCEYVTLANHSRKRISDHAGTLLVLEFWATWCSPCLKALDEAQAMLEQHHDWQDKVEIIAISVDENRAAAACFGNDKWKSLTTVWAGAEVMQRYHINALPAVYVVDVDGKVIAGDKWHSLEDHLRMLLSPAEKHRARQE